MGEELQPALASCILDLHLPLVSPLFEFDTQYLLESNTAGAPASGHRCLNTLDMCKSATPVSSDQEQYLMAWNVNQLDGLSFCLPDTLM